MIVSRCATILFSIRGSVRCWSSLRFARGIEVVVLTLILAGVLWRTSATMYGMVRKKKYHMDELPAIVNYFAHSWVVISRLRDLEINTRKNNVKWNHYQIMRNRGRLQPNVSSSEWRISDRESFTYTHLFLWEKFASY
jgi:hypothetical protein